MKATEVVSNTLIKNGRVSNVLVKCRYGQYRKLRFVFASKHDNDEYWHDDKTGKRIDGIDELIQHLIK